MKFKSVTPQKINTKAALKRAPPYKFRIEDGRLILPDFIEEKVCDNTQTELNAVPVKESGIGMVRLDDSRALGKFMLFEKLGMWARADVAAMLGNMAWLLYKFDPCLTIMIRDAYRTMKDQEQGFNDVYKEMRKTHPKLGKIRLYKIVTRLVADPKRGGLHMGGGALDMTIVDKWGRELFMGFCKKTRGIPDFDGLFKDERNSLFSPRIGKIAFQNRCILAWAATEAGLWNDVDEWWHKNGFNRAWAATNGTFCKYSDIETVEGVISMQVPYKGRVFAKKMPPHIYLRILRTSFAKARSIRVSAIPREPSILHL